MHPRRFPRPAPLVLAAAVLLCRSAGAAPAPPEGRREAPAGGAASGPFDGLGDLSSLVVSAQWDEHRRAYVSPLGDGRIARLTLDRPLQEGLTKLLATYRPKKAAIVALDPKDGRILALAEYAAKGDPSGLAVQAIYPAASVFKIVTSAALLEAGISPDTKVCFHGGLRGFGPKLLKDNPRRDWRCATMAEGLARSLNLVFGKLALKKLSRTVLEAMAGRFLFNQPLPTFPPSPTVADALVSRALIPEGDPDLPRTAAGFGEVYLSPLHGALVAAAVGNNGVAVTPRLVDQVEKNGLATAAPQADRQRIVSEATSALLTSMMERTVTQGTARRAFHGRWGRRVLGSIDVAGKTGSLDDHPPKPFNDYSWFVGFAPAEEPDLAVGAVVVNGRFWTVHAPYVAREAFRLYFQDERERTRHAAR